MIKRLRFGHSGLNSSVFKMQKHTGKSDCCEENKTIECVLLDRQNYQIEGNYMRKEFEKIKETFNIIDISQRNLGSRQIHIFIIFLKSTELFNRIILYFG